MMYKYNLTKCLLVVLILVSLIGISCTDDHLDKGANPINKDPETKDAFYPLRKNLERLAANAAGGRDTANGNQETGQFQSSNLNRKKKVKIKFQKSLYGGDDTLDEQEQTEQERPAYRKRKKSKKVKDSKVKNVGNNGAVKFKEIVQNVEAGGNVQEKPEPARKKDFLQVVDNRNNWQSVQNMENKNDNVADGDAPHRSVHKLPGPQGYDHMDNSLSNKQVQVDSNLRSEENRKVESIVERQKQVVQRPKQLVRMSEPHPERNENEWVTSVYNSSRFDQDESNNTGVVHREEYPRKTANSHGVVSYRQADDNTGVSDTGSQVPYNQAPGNTGVRISHNQNGDDTGEKASFNQPPSNTGDTGANSLSNQNQAAGNTYDTGAKAPYGLANSDTGVRAPVYPSNNLDRSFSFQNRDTAEGGAALKYDPNFGSRKTDDGRSANSYSKTGSKKKKRSFPRGKARPDVSQREDVQWSEEYHSFALKASVDNRFRIRYAPLPREGSPWPLPQFYRPESVQFLIKPHNFKLHAAGESCDILEFAFERIEKNLFGKVKDTESEDKKKQSGFRFFREADDSRSEIKTLNVTVLKECGTYPQFDMDESYDLEIRKNGAVIIAREIWGAVRGLETFSQLVHQDHHSNYVVNRTLIHDFPRFKHRGVLLDTARHFLDKGTIILNLEAMAQNKMNVFHWHIVDEQSFPFDCHTYPNLTRMGAYSSSHIYTHDDIREIINEARLRGIRVIPEFDTPGHTFAWGFGQDNLLTPCYGYDGQPDGYFGPVNPILKSTYRFLSGLFTEVLELFPDKYVHLGGDEVSLDCWQTNPFLQRFMSRNRLYDVKDLLNVYERKLIDIIHGIGRKRDVGSGNIVWQEVYDDGVQLRPNSSIVQIWKGDAWDVERVTSKGFKTLFSSCWYLDYISYGQDWDKYYRCDQLSGALEASNNYNESLLIGGDVCLWAEFADDENILSRLWPRASAAAERLWSHKDVQDTEAAAPRIEAQRCRMKRRGIPVGVLSGPGFCDKHSKKSHAGGSLFDWVNGARKAEYPHAKPDQGQDQKNVYVVDMHAMYVIPLVVVVCLVCLLILASLQQAPQRKIIAILTMPVSGTRGRVRGLIYIFMVFTIIWFVWTAPIWLHSWENSNHIKGS